MRNTNRYQETHFHLRVSNSYEVNHTIFLIQSVEVWTVWSTGDNFYNKHIDNEPVGEYVNIPTKIELPQ